PTGPAGARAITSSQSSSAAPWRGTLGGPAPNCTCTTLALADIGGKLRSARAQLVRLDALLRTEADWTVVERSPAYQKSKTLAERAAWDFAAEHPEGPELTVVNPGMVLGPALSTATSTSHEPVRMLLGRQVPGSPRVGWATVDVRDLAVAHRLAMETPEAAGKRYICAGEHLWMRDLGRLLAEEFGPRGFRVPTRQLPDLLVRAIAVVDKTVRLTVPSLGQVERLSAERAERELGWTMRPVRDSVRDTAESLLRLGVVPMPAGARPLAEPAHT
ncbi:aldehyde reductase, partial [Nocardia cyriacigeorgica]|uniref:aldehyde reductase n=1 Tax=Nocardia cyriacigeorgica TaxID=135487 RepID=UPI002453EBF0